MALTTSDQVQELYIAYYGRPADPEGLEYWTNQADSLGGVSAIVNAFGFSPEATALHEGMSTEQLVESLYEQLFSRTAELEGLQYWSGQIKSGALNLQNLAWTMINSTSAADAAVVAEKLKAANAFTAAVDTSEEYIAYGHNGSLPLDTGRTWLSSVKDATSEAAAEATIDSTLSQIVAGSGANVGENFVLTTAIDNVLGTAKNDTIIGSMDDSGSDSVYTVNPGDTINGNGGNDTFKVIMNEYDSDFHLNAVSISNVQNLLISDPTDYFDSYIYLDPANTFTSVTLEGTYDAEIYGINEGTAAKFVVDPGTGDYQYGYFEYNPTTAATVTFNDTFQGNAGSNYYNYAEFDHGYNDGYENGLANATTINSTLNLLNLNSANGYYDWAEQYIYAGNAGNANAVITANVNVQNATSDGSEYSGADVYIYQEGTATVTANINIANSDSVYLDVYADENGYGTVSPTGVANITLSNVTDTYDGSEIYLEDFGTVNVTVNGASKFDELASYSSSGADYTSQAINIVANADLTLESLDVADEGSDLVTISGAGNVTINDYDGTYDALSTTVSDKIDASALTGNLYVEVSEPINSIIGGSGDDTIIADDVTTFGDATQGGLVLTGGSGTDTVGFYQADYTGTIAAGSATARAGISGFEALALVDALGTATYDLSAISGIASFTAMDGIAAGNTATVSNIGADATITLAGDLVANNGALSGTLKTDGTNDRTTLVLNSDFADNNDTTADATAVSSTVDLSEVEKLTVNATGNQTAIFTPVTGYKADYVDYTLGLTDDSLQALTITGDQKLEFTSAITQLKLASIDASANTGGVTIDASAADTTANGAVALTIKGSATAANTLTGTQNVDTISGGAKADTITGGLGGDTLTGGAGNDTFIYASASESTITAGETDTITDFSANTVGDATTGAVQANADSTKWTGDVIDLSAVPTLIASQIKVGVYTNAADCLTFIANDSSVLGFAYAALDSSTGALYLDTNNDQVADMYMKLTGATTITAAAFKMA